MSSLDTLAPTETLEIDNGLSLVPRLKFDLTIYSILPSVSKPIDELKLKQALIHFFKISFSVPITVNDDDLVFRRVKDLKKRKRDDPVASGTLCIRDLGFLTSKTRYHQFDVQGREDVKVLEHDYLDWRRNLLNKMDGIELNLQGVKYTLAAVVPSCDDFQAMKKEWEEIYSFKNTGNSRGGRQEPDTIVLRGAPSRWFAEPRVSSKPSMLVTHTIFSTFGKIRNLSIAEDDDLGKDIDADIGGIVSGLHCKIVVQFEKYQDFCNAFKVLCCRSLQKQGSRLKADYEISWDKNGFFPNSRTQVAEKSREMQAGARKYRNEGLGRHQLYSPQLTPVDTRRKRFEGCRTSSNGIINLFEF